MSLSSTITTEAGAIDYLESSLTVSRETMGRLITYHDILVKWQSKINLISNTTLESIWLRHIVDSAQLHPLIPDTETPLIDVGTGAGFPGLVLAILGIKNMHLVESDTRKMAFLREAARITNTAVTLHHARIEQLHIEGHKIITARACASIKNLLECTRHLVSRDTQYLLLKGAQHEEELAEARKDWSFISKSSPSITDGQSVIIQISQLVDLRHDQQT